MSDFSFGSKVFPGLMKVVEEASEFLVEAAKLMGSQRWVKPWPAFRHVKAIREEVNDLQATLTFLFKHNPGLEDKDRQAEKLAKFEAWHQEQQS